MTGPAFGFSYPDNLERLEESGAELLAVDPLRDPVLPDGTQALYACGGFPEVFAAELSANETLLADRPVRSCADTSTTIRLSVRKGRRSSWPAGPARGWRAGHHPP